VTYSVGNSTVANYANTSSGKVTDVVANNGVGGSGESVNVVDRAALSFVVDTNIQFLTIDVTSLSGYIAGKSDVTITVNAGVYVYGTPPPQVYPIVDPSPPQNIAILDASLQIIGGAVGDTIKLVNNGNIVGFGGDGAGVWKFQSDCCGCGASALTTDPGKGNAALSFITPGITLSIENNGYIAGGGGGGGGVGGNSVNEGVPGGGGGAGGGISGIVGNVIGRTNGGSTVRAVPPNVGNLGQFAYRVTGCCTSIISWGGGGGGFILPGTGGTGYSSGGASGVGNGGGAGGSGAASGLPFPGHIYNNNGGSANNNAPAYTTYSDAYQGGGGGGWGASGAGGYTYSSLYQVGAVGGNSIVTNGNAYTLTGSGTLYGSVNTALRSVVYTFPTTVETGTSLVLNTIPGYTSGTNVVLLVPANVRITSNSYLTPALTISMSTVGNEPSGIRLIVNGAILGAGGRGGSEANQPRVGGTALYLTTTLLTYMIDTQNGYIASGGGGGGKNNISGLEIYGGGGAGLNGSSGDFDNDPFAYNPGVASGISTGTNGNIFSFCGISWVSGGSGGTILPGLRTNNPSMPPVGVYVGLGGQAGGSGAFRIASVGTFLSGAGGGYKESGGGSTSTSNIAGGGGGGWGGTGGTSRRGGTLVQAGAAAGKSIVNPILNNIYVTNTNNLAGPIGFTL
jgi:hypothetical protein